jgi:ABC-type phosphate transport system auxiliary subunit
VTNSIYVYDGKVINLDLENYVFEEGNKRDFSVSDIEKNYLLARNSLREKLKPELDNLTEELNSKLEKEIKRIEKHYNQTLDEYTQEITEIKNQIKLLESKKLLDNLSAHELTEIDSKLFRFYEQLKHIEENPERLKISSEKDFFIQD